MRHLLLASAALVASLSVSATAHAAAYTETATFGPLTTDFSRTVTLAAFNGSLGTLTGVTVQLSGYANFNGNVTNTAANAQSFRITEEVDINVSSSVSSLNALAIALTASQTYTGLASGGSAAFGPYNPTQSAGPSTGTPLSDFTNGPISATITTLTGTTVVGGGGNILTAINTNAGGSISVTYTYDAATPPTNVPEPASLALLGAGLLGLGAAQRRKKD